MIKALLVNNNESDMDLLESKLESYNDVKVVGKVNAASDALAILKEEHPNLLFIGMKFMGLENDELFNEINSISHHFAVIEFPTNQFKRHKNDILSFPYMNILSSDDELENIISRLAPNTHDSDVLSSSFPLLRKKNDKLLLYINSEDFRMIEIDDIAVFQFNADLRVWEVVIAGLKKPVRLKRNVNRWTILELSSNFVQVNQRYIINETHLQKVEDNICYFNEPFDELDYVKVGSYFKRKLVQRYQTL